MLQLFPASLLQPSCSEKDTFCMCSTAPRSSWAPGLGIPAPSNPPCEHRTAHSQGPVPQHAWVHPCSWKRHSKKCWCETAAGMKTPLNDTRGCKIERPNSCGSRRNLKHLGTLKDWQQAALASPSGKRWENTLWSNKQRTLPHTSVARIKRHYLLLVRLSGGVSPQTGCGVDAGVLAEEEICGDGRCWRRVLLCAGHSCLGAWCRQLRSAETQQWTLVPQKCFIYHLLLGAVESLVPPVVLHQLNASLSFFPPSLCSPHSSHSN